jgi:hypothetical protein
MEGLQVPPDLQLRLTDLTANYMLDRLGDYMSTDPAITPSVPSPFIPVNTVQQADRFAEMLALAYNNPSESIVRFAMTGILTIPVVVDINAKLLQEALNGHNYGTNEKREVELLCRFKVLEIPPVMTPTVLVDKAGIVLLWSLPEVLSSDFQVGGYHSELGLQLISQNLMWEALNPISGMLANSVADPKAKGTWRTAHGNFTSTDTHGCLNFSPAWFQQGRNVSHPHISPHASF